MVITALKAGVQWIQYRDKESTRRDVHTAALRLRDITARFGATFIVNDYADIALATRADGVHLGQDDLPLSVARKIMGADKIIGISTHNVEQAVKADKDGADYIGFGPVFHTITKDAGSPRGIGMLREVTKQVHIPVIAIGGITPDNAGSALAAGADAVAVASAILRGNIEYNISRFLTVIQSYEIPGRTS
jgi:thiamine-phosphate pyrophosphorylase